VGRGRMFKKENGDAQFELPTVEGIDFPNLGICEARNDVAVGTLHVSTYAAMAARRGEVRNKLAHRTASGLLTPEPRMLQTENAAQNRRARAQRHLFLVLGRRRKQARSTDQPHRRAAAVADRLCCPYSDATVAWMERSGIRDSVPPTQLSQLLAQAFLIRLRSLMPFAFRHQAGDRTHQPAVLGD